MAHREAVDLDLAQARFAEFQPADGERPNGKRANGNGANCQRSERKRANRDRRHADRRQGDRRKLGHGNRMAPPGWTPACSLERERADEKGKRAHVASLSSLPFSTPSLVESEMGA